MAIKPPPNFQLNNDNNNINKIIINNDNTNNEINNNDIIKSNEIKSNEMNDMNEMNEIKSNKMNETSFSQNDDYYVVVNLGFIRDKCKNYSISYYQNNDEHIFEHCLVNDFIIKERAFFSFERFPNYIDKFMLNEYTMLEFINLISEIAKDFEICLFNVFICMSSVEKVYRKIEKIVKG